MAHKPVMLTEMLEAMLPRQGQTYVDATFGGGGYSQAILDKTDCRVVGVDCDPDAVQRGKELATREPRFTMIHGRFSDLPGLLSAQAISTVDGIVADIGVSSYQLDQRARGFSFKQDGPLDMRMSGVGETAADIVNGWEPKELARLFRRLGEDPEGSAIARAIAKRREQTPFSTTADLAETVAQAKRRVKPGRDPATQVFQALRMKVNNELGELEALLAAAPALLNDGGRLVIVAFHSIEDRLVKTNINGQGGREVRPSRYQPERAETFAPVFVWVHRKPRLPTETEVRGNPRARSARLRVAVRQPASTIMAANDDLESDMPCTTQGFVA